MSRTLLASTVLGILSAVTVQAQTPKSFLGSLDFSAPATKPLRDVTCANFAGTWKGTCSDQSDHAPVEESFTITQKDCGNIEVQSDKNKMSIQVGGTVSMGGAIPGNPAINFGGSLVSNWDKDHKVLSLYVNGGGKELTIDGNGAGYSMTETVQLASDTKLAVAATVAGSANKTFTCSFDKQAR